MKAWKYVMFRDKHGAEFAVLFPAAIDHDEMAEATSYAFRSSEVHQGKRDYRCPEPVSAGFVSGLTVLTAMGLSETLGLPARADDLSIINTQEARE